MYKPGPLDPDNEYWHIVSFVESKEKVFLVKDFEPDASFKYVTFADDRLYLASDKMIKIGSISTSAEMAG
jgi:hypothetical protein